jgi:hypothetical protein
MAAIYLTVEGNLEPSIQVTLNRNKVPIDLTGCTVVMRIQDTQLKTITNTGHQDCTLPSDLTTGVVSYPVQTGDFAHPSHDYLAECEITHPGGRPETIYEQIIINPRKKLA